MSPPALVRLRAVPDGAAAILDERRETGGWRAWIGAAYLETDRTLTIRQDSPELGAVVVEVDQRPVDPLTDQVGGSLGIGKRRELLLEAGSNFDDAFVGVFSASFRF